MAKGNAESKYGVDLGEVASAQEVAQAIIHGLTDPGTAVAVRAFYGFEPKIEFVNPEGTRSLNIIMVVDDEGQPHIKLILGNQKHIYRLRSRDYRTIEEIIRSLRGKDIPADVDVFDYKDDRPDHDLIAFRFGKPVRSGADLVEYFGKDLDSVIEALSAWKRGMIETSQKRRGAMSLWTSIVE